MPKLASLETCTGCMACVDVCPKQALTSEYNEEGHLSYKLNPSLCINCSLCERVCPIISNLDYGNNNLTLSQPFASWATSMSIRKSSTSGGVFAMIAKKILEDGGYVVGACLENNQVKHILIKNCNDLYKLQGSKYTQSNTTGIYKEIKENLQNGKTILFSGLGCQVAGIKNYMSKFKFIGKLYTIDLICGGVPSNLLITKYLDQYKNSVKEIAGFRNKSKYEFSVITTNGIKKIIPLTDRPFPLCGFYTELTNRYSCYNCQFAKGHRLSDITIGDYWGDREFIEQHKNGISVVIIHSSNGKKLIKEADLEIHPIKWGQFLLNNPRMVYGVSKLGKTKARKELTKNFQALPYDKLLEIYANKAHLTQPIKFIKKILRFVVSKHHKKQILKNVKKLLKKYEDCNNNLSLF